MTSINITNVELFKALRDQQICAVGPIKLSEVFIPQYILQKLEKLQSKVDDLKSLVSDDQVVLTLPNFKKDDL